MIKFYPLLGYVTQSALIMPTAGLCTTKDLSVTMPSYYLLLGSFAPTTGLCHTECTYKLFISVSTAGLSHTECTNNAHCRVMYHKGSVHIFYYQIDVLLPNPILGSFTLIFYIGYLLNRKYYFSWFF